jgi:hypothetical protein
MKSNEERLQDLLAYVDSLTRVHPSEIPGIDLYMDQVTTFMDSHLNTSKWLGEDKILTKTMINNYAKNKIYQIFLSFSESEDESFSVSIGST